MKFNNLQDAVNDLKKTMQDSILHSSGSNRNDDNARKKVLSGWLETNFNADDKMKEQEPIKTTKQFYRHLIYSGSASRDELKPLLIELQKRDEMLSKEKTTLESDWEILVKMKRSNEPLAHAHLFDCHIKSMEDRISLIDKRLQENQRWIEDLCTRTGQEVPLRKDADQQAVHPRVVAYNPGNPQNQTPDPVEAYKTKQTTSLQPLETGRSPGQPAQQQGQIPPAPLPPPPGWKKRQ